MPITGTPISSSSGWVTVLEADQYFGARHGIGTLWSDLPPEAKTALLTTAQSDIEHSPQFTFTEDDKATPVAAMKHAVCEQALFRLLDPDIDIRSALLTQGVSAAGLVQEQYNKTSQQVPIAPKARQVLSAYTSTRSTISSVSGYRPESRS